MNDQQHIIDFLKDYHPSTPATYKIATSLLAGLRESSLKELSQVANDRFIRYRIKRMMKASSAPKRNTPVKKLLSLYTNKKSGKVVPSREELFRRFPYLDASQQKRVAEAFLDGSYTDIETMSNYLMGHWDDMYLDIARKAWLSSRGNGPLAKLVIRYFPLDFVVEHMPELKAFDGPMLAIRRCQAGEKLRIDDWPLTDYLAIVYNSGMSMDEEDATYLMESYLVNATFAGKESGRVPDYTQKSDIRQPSLIYLEGVRLLLYYLGVMGFTKALALFEKLDSETLLKMDDGSLQSILDGDSSREEKITAIWKKFCDAFLARYNDKEVRVVQVKHNSDATPCICYGNEQTTEFEPGFVPDSEDYPEVDSEFNFRDPRLDDGKEVEDGVPF